MNKRVFVSSTYKDLVEFRESVQNAIRQVGAVDISMEHFGARDERPKGECLRIIHDETDVFVGIYAHRYGFIPSGDDMSITEAEYHAATSAGIPRLIYLVDEETPWIPAYIDRDSSYIKLRQFKDRLLAKHMCGFFSNPDNLAMKVAADLGRYFSLRELKHVERAVPPTTGPMEHEGLKTTKEWIEHRHDIEKRNREVYLIHALRPSRKPKQKFDVYIYLVRHRSEDLSDIDHAMFFLGRHWGNRVFHVQNEGGLIGISISAYGPVLCTCRVTFKDGYEVHLSRYIDFEMGKTIEL